MRAQAEKPFAEMFSGAGILDEFEGSDHAPVYADLQLPNPLSKGPSAPALDLRNRRTAAGAHPPCFSVLCKRAWCYSVCCSAAYDFGSMTLHRQPTGAADTVADKP